MFDFRIDPPLVVKDTPKPRPLGSLAEAAAFFADAMRLGRPPPWRDMYERLRAVGSEEDAIEVIGALRELFELEDLLVPPKLGFTRAPRPSEGAGAPATETEKSDDQGCDAASRRDRGRRGSPRCGQ